MWQTFWRFSREKRWLLLTTPLLVWIEVLTELQQPKLLSTIINGYTNNESASLIWTTSLKMVFYLLISLIAMLLSIYSASLVSAYFGKNLRQFLFTHLSHLSLSQINQQTPGALLTRLTNDINQGQNLMMQTLRQAMRAPLMFIGSLFFLLHINWQLLSIVLLLAPIILIVIFVVAKFALPIFRQGQKLLDRLNNFMSEHLQAIRTIKSFNQEKMVLKHFETLNQKIQKLAQRSIKIMALAMPVMMFVLNLAIALILWQGAQLFAHEQIALGDLVAAIGYLTQLLFAFLMMSFIFINLIRTKVSLTRINQVLKLEADPQLKIVATTDHTITTGEIIVQDLSFTYPQNQQTTLQNINLHIEAGTNLGIIGVTGSGKSTLAYLLARLYQPEEGKILIDNLDLQTLAPTAVHNNIVLVTQQPFLLSGTIIDNLNLGDKISQGKITQALKTAQAHNFVQLLPQKGEAPVAPAGRNFSGGEKQRLNLARALAHQPKILILDDITSALDLKTAHQLHQALQQEQKNMTKIIISQRIADVKHCQQIIVLDHGQIQAQGTHQQLLKSNQLYQTINRLQEDNYHG